MKNIRVLSKNKLIDYESKISYPHIIISIRDTGMKKLLFSKNKNRISVLHLAFDDVDTDFYLSGSVFMSEEQAENIINFVRSFDHINDIIVQCKAGISRSAAVAMAISRYYNGNEGIFKDNPYNPNPYVYNLVLEEFRKQGNRNG